MTIHTMSHILSYPLFQQELLIRREIESSPPSVFPSLFFVIMFCRSFIVILSFFSIGRCMITASVSQNFSWLGLYFVRLHM